MRVLTNSGFNNKGLISIFEASENSPQTVVFCIPIEKYEAERIKNILDFDKHFYRGISTKIKDQEGTTTIYLDYEFPHQYINEINQLPKFVANIKGHKIDFYLSPLNFLSNNKQRLNFDFFYSGNILKDLHNKSLIILEPNWLQLDKLFLDKKVIFIDWR